MKSFVRGRIIPVEGLTCTEQGAPQREMRRKEGRLVGILMISGCTNKTEEILMCFT